MSYMLQHLHNGWQVDQAIMSEEDRVVIIRFGHDWDPTCMVMDETLYRSVIDYEYAEYNFFSAPVQQHGGLICVAFCLYVELDQKMAENNRALKGGSCNPVIPISNGKQSRNPNFNWGVIPQSQFPCIKKLKFGLVYVCGIPLFQFQT